MQAEVACMQVTTIIGPATLAVFALNIQVSFLDTATALFGYYLAGQITVRPSHANRHTAAASMCMCSGP